MYGIQASRAAAEPRWLDDVEKYRIRDLLWPTISTGDFLPPSEIEAKTASEKNS